MQRLRKGLNPGGGAKYYRNDKKAQILISGGQT